MGKANGQQQPPTAPKKQTDEKIHIFNTYFF